MKRFFSIVLLTLAYSLATLSSRLLRRFRKKPPLINRVIVNGTFHNPNWFHAHITPLVRSGFGEVILVCDAPVANLPNLVYHCPPPWANAIFSRAGAKFLWTFKAAWLFPANMYVGYHIFPSAVTALICGRAFGGQVAYQLTAGELELEGGGWNVENKVMVGLGEPSPLVERMAHVLLREFDLAVVRGTNAKNYVLKQNFNQRLEIVTGSVEVGMDPCGEKDIDLIFVGRLSEYKRPDRLIEVINEVVQRLPNCHATFVGDGPDREDLEARVRELKLEHNIEFLGQRSDVLHLMSRAKTFVLTSRWEGVSIAMLEAMATGAVPIVSKVGDLQDFAQNGVTGYTIDEENLSEFVDRIVHVLSNEEHRLSLASNARELVVKKCSREMLSNRWRSIFDGLTKQESS